MAGNEAATLTPPTPPANFDGLARVYAALERLTFGRALARRRSRFLGDVSVAEARRALILGDGDGRFTAALLELRPELEVSAVDASAAMLALLEARVRRQLPSASLDLQCADARSWLPERAGYDLAVSHFFFDCFSSAEVRDIVARIAPVLSPTASWLFSDFAIPQQRTWAFFARALVRSLYFAQRVITGLRVTELPDHAAAFQSAGFALVEASTSLGGILRSELWRRQTNPP